MSKAMQSIVDTYVALNRPEALRQLQTHRLKLIGSERSGFDLFRQQIEAELAIVREGLVRLTAPAVVRPEPIEPEPEHFVTATVEPTFGLEFDSATSAQQTLAENLPKSEITNLANEPKMLPIIPADLTPQEPQRDSLVAAVVAAISELDSVSSIQRAPDVPWAEAEAVATENRIIKVDAAPISASTSQQEAVNPRHEPASATIVEPIIDEPSSKHSGISAAGIAVTMLTAAVLSKDRSSNDPASLAIRLQLNIGNISGMLKREH